MPTFYEILGVNKDASEREIRKAYINLIRRYHPDLNQNREQAKKKTQKINEAYSVLKDSVKRANYDRFLDSQFDHSQEKIHEEKPPPSSDAEKKRKKSGKKGDGPTHL